MPLLSHTKEPTALISNKRLDISLQGIFLGRGAWTKGLLLELTHNFT